MLKNLVLTHLWLEVSEKKLIVNYSNCSSLVFAVHLLITQFRPSVFRKNFKKQTVLTSIRGLSYPEWQAILEIGKNPLVFVVHLLITQFRPSAFRKNFKKQTVLTSIHGLSYPEWQAILEIGKNPLVFVAHLLITQFRPSAFRKNFKKQTIRRLGCS